MMPKQLLIGLRDPYNKSTGPVARRPIIDRATFIQSQDSNHSDKIKMSGCHEPGVTLAQIEMTATNRCDKWDALLWHMGIMALQLTRNLTVYSTACLG